MPPLIHSGSAAHSQGPGGENRVEEQTWFSQIKLVTETLRAERTALTSPMFPMEYVGVQGIEAWRRWPEMMVAIEQARASEDLGAHFRRPGMGVNATHFFSLASLPVAGAERLRALGYGGPDDSERAKVVMDFFRRTAGAWRADGFTTSFASGGSVRPYAAVHTAAIAGQAEAIDPVRLAAFRRSLAAITQYSFLLNIECRVGTGDSGPYPLSHDRVLVIREIADLGLSWRPWSAVAQGVRHERLVFGLVLRPAVSIRITDIATTFATPGSLLDHVEAVALFAASNEGHLTPIILDDLDQLAVDVGAASHRLYRLLSGLSYSDKLAAGILVYFSMIRPWAEHAGVVDSFDWKVPDACLPMLGRLGIDYRAEDRSLT